MTEIDWPHLLADLTAKRDALNQVIALIAKHFIPAAAELVINVPGAEPLPAPRPRVTKPGHAKKTKKERSQPWMPAAAGTVQARDAAILNQLRKGPAATSALVDALPKEPGQSDEQRADACRNALTRLRVKKVIKQSERGEWALVA